MNMLFSVRSLHVTVYVLSETRLESLTRSLKQIIFKQRLYLCVDDYTNGCILYCEIIIERFILNSDETI